MSGLTKNFGERYEVAALLGKGGMGEVYRAHDKRLRRDVALKVLPETLAGDPNRVALFQREAQVIASLNHRNIAAIHELEESGSLRWLVLELVHGETLEERLKRGRLRIHEALLIARQICDALEAAHERGVIHRDLKPANIKITPDETVKLLDFGLASAFEVNPRTTDLGGSPTIPSPSSVVPPHAGTAAYMSPEQFQWKTITKQVDVWAFGCVLFEMLTGTYAFQADTLRETATLILEAEPDWSRLKHAPPRLVDLTRRCLEKDRKIRLHDIADVRIEIDRLLEGKTAFKEPAASTRRKSSQRLLALAALVFVAGVAAGLVLLPRGTPPAAFPAVRFSIPVTQTNSITQISVSPDGRKIAYVAGNAQGVRIVWIRDTDNSTAKPLTSAEDPGGLFWSADGEHIAFFGQQELRIADVYGGGIQSIGQSPGSTSGSWSKSGDILIDSSEGGGLFRVSAAGGSRTQVTFPDRSAGERHYQPQFLPDGRQFLYLIRTNQPNTTGIYLGSLDSSKRQFLINTSSKAMFSAPSHLLFVRDGTLFSQSFQMDPPQMMAEPVRIAEHVSVSAISGSAAFGVSANGVLAYRSGSAFQNSVLCWFDRQGKDMGTIGEPAVYTQAVLSPDEKHIATERRDPDSGYYDIWLADPVKNTSTRLTFDDSSERSPVWHPDSQHIVFSSDKSGWSVLRMGIDSTAGAEVILKGENVYRPMDITSNNEVLLRDDGRAFFRLTPGERQPRAFLQTLYMKSGGRLSPDGKWLAFNSGDSGRNEVYVVPFPSADRRRRISTNGGVQPLWNSTGSEIFFLDLQGYVMASAFSEENSLTDGIPKSLFATGITPSAGLNQYLVNGKGSRFLTITPVPQEEVSPIDVVINWSEAQR